MKKLMGVILGLFSLTIATSTFALYESNVSKSPGSQRWVCETNASRATTDVQKRADEMMSKKSGSAASAFGFAVKNCRDCTKITCSVDKRR